MNPPQASAASNLPLAQALEAKSLKDLDQDSPVATRGDSLVSSKSFLQKLGHWPVLAWTAIAVSLIGCQSLVASGLHQPRLTVMLPFGAGDDRLRQQFLRGFSIGEASVKACGLAPARVGWLALPPDASPDAVLPDAIDHQLVVAPPAADLRAFGRFAERRQLSVLLPYQRGASLTVLAGLEGRERLWPLVPPRKDDLQAIAEEAVREGWGWAMVVQDLDALESTETEAFVELFGSAGGAVKSYDSYPIQTVNPADDASVKLLSQDLLWSNVPTMVIAAEPAGPLARVLGEMQRKGDLGVGLTSRPNWIWLSDAEQLDAVQIQPWQQMGLKHPARGEGWSVFSNAFQQRWDEQPSLLEASGYDTARILALADSAPLPVSQEGTKDPMGWVDPDAKPVSICEGLKRRRDGQSLRLKAAASDFRLRAGQAPSGDAVVGLLNP